jgi:hypothetical protein
MMVLDIDYIRINKFSELTGWTVGAIQSKIKRGDWLQGKQYIKAPDGSILISLNGYEQWAKMKASARPQKQVMKSPLHIGVNDAANESNLSPMPLTESA